MPIITQFSSIFFTWYTTRSITKIYARKNSHRFFIIALLSQCDKTTGTNSFVSSLSLCGDCAILERFYLHYNFGENSIRYVLKLTATPLVVRIVASVLVFP